MEDASMTSENVSGAEAVESMKAVSAKAGDDHLIDELVSRAQTEGPQLTGEDGLPQQLTERLLESALEGEITDHLGYDKHDPAGRNGGAGRPRWTPSTSPSTAGSQQPVSNHQPPGHTVHLVLAHIRW
jgi:hypothetical protein